MLNYTIINSGSDGNSVLIENTMIDIGLPYKKLKPYLYNVTNIFITHKHSDHLNKSTARKIGEMFPSIKFYANKEVCLELRKLNIEPIEVELDVIYENMLGFDECRFFLAPHNVLCFGVIAKVKGKNIIYVTDSAGTDTWLGKHTKGYEDGFDYLFIESNHDEVKLRAMAREKHGFAIINNSQRHASTQESRKFYYLNRRERESEWIELHKSSRFY